MFHSIQSVVFFCYSSTHSTKIYSAYYWPCVQQGIKYNPCPVEVCILVERDNQWTNVRWWQERERVGSVKKGLWDLKDVQKLRWRVVQVGTPTQEERVRPPWAQRGDSDKSWPLFSVRQEAMDMFWAEEWQDLVNLLEGSRVLGGEKGSREHDSEASAVAWAAGWWWGSQYGIDEG